MQLTIQVLASAALVLAVLWFMFKIPRRGDALFGWAPPMALISVWVGVAALLATVGLWWLPQPDRWLVGIFLFLDPGAIAGGTLVLWIYRGFDAPGDAVAMQRLQAKVAITLGLAAVVLGYIYVMTHKTPFTPVGQ